MSAALIVALLGTVALSAVFVPVVIRLARRFGAIKAPQRVRDIHSKPTPEWGGLGIYVAFALVVSYFTWVNPLLLGRGLSIKEIVGVLIAGFILVVGGALDDKYDLSPAKQILISLVAVLVVIVAGIGAREVTNPLGGTINLARWEWVVFWYHGIGYRLTLPSDILTAIWLLAMIYTTKFLDGVDGLASGVTAIGALVIAGFTLITRWYQPNVGLMGAIAAGAFIGFLIWNWHPAKIFLGNGGSMFAGFILGVLSVISGGKIATALLVMGLPLLDVCWVVFRRIVIERRSPFAADRKHLHHRLLDAGFSMRQAALFYYAVAGVFGVAALLLQSRQKLFALGALVFFMVGLGSYLVVRLRRRNRKHHV